MASSSMITARMSPHRSRQLELAHQFLSKMRALAKNWKQSTGSIVQKSLKIFHKFGIVKRMQIHCSNDGFVHHEIIKSSSGDFKSHRSQFKELVTFIDI